MSDRSKIEWTDATWNPVTGCTKVSAGCKHCYAERYAKRGLGDWRGRLNGVVCRKFTDVRLHPDRLDQPLRWRKPRRVFVVSMGDLFHEAVPVRFILDVFQVMSACPQHTFQLLTKRPERIAPVLFGEEGRFYLGGNDYLPNVWIGTSVENQASADQRIPLLMASGWLGVKWVSVEPMLEPVDLACWLPFQTYRQSAAWSGLDWIIVGGESGPGARPTNPDWARSVRDQCVASGVPFLFKQWGEWCPGPGDGMHRAGKKAAGRLLDGTLWEQYPGDVV